MADKHLILLMPGEHDTLVTVVPLDANFQTKMELRLRRLNDLHAEDDALDEHVFGACGDAWLLEEIGDWMEANEDAAALLEDRCWVLVDGAPPFDDDRRTRVSVCELHLTRHGSYYWSVLPKHWNTTYESTSFYLDRDKIGAE